MPAIASQLCSRLHRIGSEIRFVPFVVSILLLLTTQISMSGPLPQLDRIRIVDSAPVISDAQLLDQDGQPFQMHSLHGRVVLVLFGFTNCPDVCPLGMQRMQMLENSAGFPNDDVAFVLISVDGERDTPAVLNSFISAYSSSFIGLTADPGVVKKIAKEFSVKFFKGHSAGSHDDYSVSHSPQIFILDPAGKLRAEAYSASIEAMHDIVTALLDESSIESGNANNENNYE